VVGVPVIDTGPMTVEEFYAFTDTRPDEEKWELFDGEPVLNAAPSDLHQWIVRNLVVALALQERELSASWAVIPGIGARVSDVSRPEPDVMILPRLGIGLDPSRRDTTKAMVLFEIMSPSTSSRDLKWKRAAYTGMPALSHYVVIAQDAVNVVVFDRAVGFEERRLTSLSDAVEFPALGAVLPLSEIYRDTHLSWVRSAHDFSINKDRCS
jgi:Uma2 family endonuclease